LIPEFYAEPWKIIVNPLAAEMALEMEKRTIPLLNLEGKSKPKILEVGAELGIRSLILKLISKEATVYLLDVSGNALVLAKRLFDFFHVLEDRYFVVADGQKLPFTEQLFDAVFCYATVHHMANPENFLKQASRVLKEGGIFLACAEAAFASSWVKNLALQTYYRRTQAFAKKFGILEKNLCLKNGKMCLKESGFRKGKIQIDYKNVSVHTFSPLVKKVTKLVPETIIKRLLGSAIRVYAKK